MKWKLRMLTKKFLLTLTAVGLTCLTATQGWALTTATTTTTTTTTNSTAISGASGGELVSHYTKLTGSTANAQSLVTGLRTGSAVTLTSTSGAPAVSFTPATQPMGFGNINIVLSLAKTTLTKQGITNPTPEQLAAALNGGKITLTNGTVVTLTGVLTQRAAGMGWGKIAQAMGVKLGAVVSASKSDHAGKKDHVAKIDDDSKKENAVKTVKADKTEKVEKAEKVEKTDNDKKDVLAKVETAKNSSTTSSGGSSSGSNGGSGSGSSSHGGGSGNGSSNGGGGGGGSSHGNGGGSGSSNGGGGGGGGSHGGGGGGGKK